MRKPLLNSVGLGVALLSAHAMPEVVYDGSIGSNLAGTTDSGDFFILESAGEVRGSNLFHSFERFNVLTNESATFVHTSVNTENIIARVTGTEATQINGLLQTAFFDGVDLFFTDAALWLLNPNGIFIGDGAEINTLGAVNLSTANRIGFANGEDFYSHEVSIGSTLSVAAPTTFGFLDKQALPANIAPEGITLEVNDPLGTNESLFLADLYLVGTSTDPGTPSIHISGDINGQFRDDANLLLESSEIQLANLGLFALATDDAGQGSSINIFDLATFPASGPAGDIIIENAYISLRSSLAGIETELQAYGENLVVSNSVLEGLTLLQPTDITLFAETALAVLDSNISSLNTDASDSLGGDINLDAGALLLLNSDVIASDSEVFGASGPRGGTGDINVGDNSELINVNIEEGSRVATVGLFDAAAGDIYIEAINLFVGGGTGDINLASTNRGAGGSGNVLLNLGNEIFIAGTEESRVTVSSQNFGGGDPGDIVLLANRIDTDWLDVFSAGAVENNRPEISILGGNDGILMTNGAITNASTTTQEFSGADISVRSAGDLSIASARNIFSIQSITAGNQDAGLISLEAGGDLLLFGGVRITNFTDGLADSTGQAQGIVLSGTNVTIEATDGVENDNGLIAVLNSSTSTTADSNGISITATEQLLIDGQVGLVSQSTGPGDAGSIALNGNSIFIQNMEAAAPSRLNSESRAGGDGGEITLSAEDQLSLLGNVSISSDALASGNAGEIRFTAANILLEGDQLLVTSQAPIGSFGDAGPIELAATDTIGINGIQGIFNQSLGSGGPGDIRLSGDNLIVIDAELNNAVFSPTSSSERGQLELLSGQDLLLSNALIVANAGGLSTAGGVVLEAGNDISIEDSSVQSSTFEVDGFDGAFAGDVRITAGRQLFLSGDGTDILANATGVSNGGNVNVSTDVFLMVDDAVIQTASEQGLAGNINLEGRQVEIFSKGLDTFSSAGGGGNVNVFASEQLTLFPGGNLFALSESSTADGDGGSINLGSENRPIPLLLIRGSVLSASAQAGNGGQINVFADNFLRDARSALTVSSVTGEPGALEINAPEQDISAAIADLNVGLLDATKLIQDSCAAANETAESSSLMLGGQGGIPSLPDGYRFSTRTTQMASVDSASSQGSVELYVDASFLANTGCYRLIN